MGGKTTIGGIHEREFRRQIGAIDRAANRTR
jgi:hypothetical protein